LAEKLLRSKESNSVLFSNLT